jgi:hypothetical protein
MTDAELMDLFNVNEKIERLFADYLFIDGLKNFISIEQEVEEGPRLIIQNLIAGPAENYETVVGGDLEQMGLNCELLVSVILDRQDSMPDFKRINEYMARVRVALMRHKLRSLPVPSEYILAVEGWTFSGVGHTVNEKDEDVITLQFNYPLFLNAQV